jgi:hypothetical protein
MNRTVKLPGTKRLKVHRDEPLSKFAFKFNLRRYNLVASIAPFAAMFQVFDGILAGSDGHPAP